MPAWTASPRAPGNSHQATEQAAVKAAQGHGKVLATPPPGDCLAGFRHIAVRALHVMILAVPRVRPGRPGEPADRKYSPARGTAARKTLLFCSETGTRLKRLRKTA
jgi:hypothetical protein